MPTSETRHGRQKPAAESRLLSLPQIIHCLPHDRPAVCPGDAGKKCQIRAVNLCPRWLHRENHIRSQPRSEEYNSHHQHPAPGPAGPQHPQQDACRQYQQCGEQQIVNEDIDASGSHAAKRSQQIKPSIALLLFFHVHPRSDSRVVVPRSMSGLSGCHFERSRKSHRNFRRSRRIPAAIGERALPQSRKKLFQSAIKNQQSSICIKPPPTLPSQPSGVDHLDQQRTRPVFRIAQARPAAPA